ncbi:MAG: Nramp family divalent metal transporter [Deltaproteobacteria bacterium]|jgi:Mn2+/Fe2+ NRAMP family transporter|nr:Nramp family divalent metal transporter [Deltaproteobacteria bacterium]MBW2534775.1 Nramp family divalent metal transporter [Deltaproteobacteria bacterium]
MSGAERRVGLLAIIGPGLITAATGVGAGDLATGSLAGSRLGVAVLWALWVGAGLKLLLTEGIARWQLATGESLLDGALRRLGRIVAWTFLPYLLLWSFFVGSALIGACGVAGHALLPLFDARTDKIIWGAAHSLVGLVLVWCGGFKLFERLMSVAVALMFVTVVGAATSMIVAPPPAHADALGAAALLRGALMPSIPQMAGGGIGWTVALMGGVGGTVTVLAYGYWIREHGRTGPADLRTCRIDLTVGYGATALFGMAMVVLGSTIHVEGSGATLVVRLAERLQEPLGLVGRWAFLLGAWAGLFSSLLGVWQSVPYLFADLRRAMRRKTDGDQRRVDTKGTAYRGYLIALALVPMLALGADFSHIQKLYAILGALFMPMLAVTLLLLNSRRAWIGARLRNGPITIALLVATVLLFAWFGWLQTAAQWL